MRIGGPKALTDAVKAAGGEVGPCAMWAGSWDIGTNLSGWDPFFRDCKAAGLTPQVNAWLFGPSMNLVTNQVEADKRVALLVNIMTKAKAAGVAPWVMLEPEAAIKDSTAYAAYWDRLLAAVRTCPGAKGFWSPGVWVNHAQFATFYAKQVAAADGVGLQSVKFAPRHGIAGLQNSVNELKAAFVAYPNKLHVIYDVMWSTYGGTYSPTFPFAGGDGKALEPLQATLFQQLGAALSGMVVDTVVYRDLKDNLNYPLDESRWGGWAERFCGISHADSSHKPSYDALMALAKPLAPTTFTRAEMDAVAAQRDKAIIERDMLQAELIVALEASAALKAQVTALTGQMVSATAETASWKGRIQAIRDALA